MAEVRGPTGGYDAIVLAGGRSSRLGADKTRLAIDGVPVLDRVLAAVADAGRRIVVGQPRPVATEVSWAREDPVGGGPAAGVVAGLSRVTAPVTLLLAADLPRLDAATVRRLLAASRADGPDESAPDETGPCETGPYEGAILVDATGRRQNLTCAVATAALRRVAAARSDWHDAAMHELLAPLRLRPVAVQGHEADDIDTPAQLSGVYGVPGRYTSDNSKEERS